MPKTLDTICADEINNFSRIICYKEGDSWVSYNRSAYFLTHLPGAENLPILSTYMDGCAPVVSCSLSKEKLELHLSSCRGILHFENRITADVPSRLDIHEYYKWKRKINIRNWSSSAVTVSIPKVTENKEIPVLETTADS